MSKFSTVDLYIHQLDNILKDCGQNDQQLISKNDYIEY
jgi:hypothetical protein